jgi:hypothetical protein
MRTRPARRLALGTVAALGLYTATLGLPMAGLCGGIAGAAPSPTCGGDLRECLRLSAKTGLYGARYVEADDVARCVEAFNACIHGSSGGSANPPPSTSVGGGGRKGLPAHLGITYDGVLVSDCRVSGEAVTCKIINPNAPVGNQDSWTSEVTGTLSGLTMTGTKTIRVTGHYDGEPGCLFTEEASGPATYVFSSDGTVSMREGPIQWQHTDYGSCSNSYSQTVPETEGTAKWSAIQ